MAMISKRTKEQMDITIELSKEAKGWIIDQGYDSKYGARPLRRTLQNKIEDRLAEEILDGNIRSGDQVHVGLEEGELKFSV